MFSKLIIFQFITKTDRLTRKFFVFIAQIHSRSLAFSVFISEFRYGLENVCKTKRLRPYWRLVVMQWVVDTLKTANKKYRIEKFLTCFDRNISLLTTRESYQTCLCFYWSHSLAVCMCSVCMTTNMWRTDVLRLLFTKVFKQPSVTDWLTFNVTQLFYARARKYHLLM